MNYWTITVDHSIDSSIIKRIEQAFKTNNISVKVKKGKENTLKCPINMRQTGVSKALEAKVLTILSDAINAR